MQVSDALVVIHSLNTCAYQALSLSLNVYLGILLAVGGKRILILCDMRSEDNQVQCFKDNIIIPLTFHFQLAEPLDQMYGCGIIEVMSLGGRLWSDVLPFPNQDGFLLVCSSTFSLPRMVF